MDFFFFGVFKNYLIGDRIFKEIKDIYLINVWDLMYYVCIYVLVF